jgi:hypothetical protein
MAFLSKVTMQMKLSRFVFLCLFLAACGGRTPLAPPRCVLSAAPKSLDFGEVAQDQTVTMQIRVANGGQAACSLRGIALSASSDAWFALAPVTPTALLVAPGRYELLSVAFRPARVTVPLGRKGELGFDLEEGDGRTQHFGFPLSAQIRSRCQISVSPAAVDFGYVDIDSTATAVVTIANMGDGPCDVGQFALAAGSDLEFALPAGPAGTVTVEAGAERQVTVAFQASDAKLPHHRTGTLAFASTDSKHPSFSVPLAADIDVGCEPKWKPQSLDLGVLTLNTEATGSVTLGNDGTATCHVTGLGLAPGGDANFSLADARDLDIMPGTIATLTVRFAAADSSPPHRKTATLVWKTGGRLVPEGSVPLSATIDTPCSEEASRWIYTLEGTGQLSRFDPSTLTFKDIGIIRCSNTGPFNSMAVDQTAVAWVGTQTGEIFKVDTKTAKCESTSFDGTHDGLINFGMGFVFDPTANKDTLYIAADIDQRSSTLATIALPSMAATVVGIISDGLPELTGTGDGALWGFIPKGQGTSMENMLLRIDTTSGKTLETHTYSSLSSGNWALKFWGGSFWIFLGRSIYEVPRKAPDTIKTAIADTGRNILGAGVSSCAPLN